MAEDGSGGLEWFSMTPLNNNLRQFSLFWNGSGCLWKSVGWQTRMVQYRMTKDGFLGSKKAQDSSVEFVMANDGSLEFGKDQDGLVGPKMVKYGLGCLQVAQHGLEVQDVSERQSG